MQTKKSAITDSPDYYLAISEIEKYLQKGLSNLTPEEEDKLHLLSIDVEQYELKQYPKNTEPLKQFHIIIMV